jgi:hypothetical protein
MVVACAAVVLIKGDDYQRVGDEVGLGQLGLQKALKPRASVRCASVVSVVVLRNAGNKRVTV